MPTQHYYMFFDFQSEIFTMEGNSFVTFLFKTEEKML